MDVISLSSPPNPIQRFFFTERSTRIRLAPGGHNCCNLRSCNAQKVFDEIPLRDTFAWNNLIQTHISNGNLNHVPSTYFQMLVLGVPPDRHTLPRVLSASTHLGDIVLGRQVHGHALKLGFSSDQYAITALIDMYGRLDSVDKAKTLFHKSPGSKNAVSWTLLARLYISQDKPDLALDMFHQMVDIRANIDSVALATASSACGLLKSLQQGKKVHEIARKCGLEFDVLVSNSLLKMYVDCDSIRDAREIFIQMPLKDVISWTALIQAYVKKGEFNEGLKLFRQMNIYALKHDSASIASILPACARVTALKHGKEIHGYLLRNDIDLNNVIQNALMDMYFKSGDIESALRIFIEMRVKDSISWTVMLCGYSMHRQGRIAVELFHQMEKKSYIHIDQTTYAAALHACSTACMVDEGKFYFNCIEAPTASHYSSMVSLLARSGLFDKARTFIEEYKLQRNTEVLRKLLEGCRIHQQLKLGKQIVEQLCELEPLNPDNYVLLLNWYADSGNLERADRLRETIRDMGLKPRKAYSWIQLQTKVHVFGTGDVSHPRSKRIYSELDCLMETMRREEPRVSSNFSLHNVDEERECIQIGHSELLALSFGLISSQGGGAVRLTKNLPVCHSCHEFAKFVSKIERREIILREPNLFHHFKDGLCSCEDFW